MEKIQKNFIIGLILMVSASLSGAPALAASSEMSSGSYKMEAVNFGQEVVLYSTQDSILPAISAEGPVTSELKATSVIIKWTTDKSSNSVVHYGATTSYGTQVGNFTTLTKTHEVQLFGLTPDTAYHYKVASEDRVGNIGESTDKIFTTPKTPAVSGLKITDITLNSAIVSFTTATIVHATLNYGTTTGYGTTVAEDSGSYTTNHTIRLANLTQGTTYNLKITGTDEHSESVNSDNYTFSTLPLPSVENLTVSDITANTAVISWKTNVATDSMVEYYTNSDVTIEGLEIGEKQTAGATPRVTEHSVKLTSLLGETIYYFKAISQDEHSNRVESSQVSFVTLKDSTAPVISKVKTDSSLGSGGETDKVQAVVTWETDELSTSQISYGLGSKEGAKDSSTTEEMTYTTSHYVVLQDLRPSATYHIKAISRDPASNAAESKVFTVLTPKKRRSLIQLITEKLQETFGWVKKTGIF